MNRRLRRQLTLVGAAALAGAAAPLWAPAILRNFDAFRVEGVEIVGARFVAPEDVRDLVALEPDVSVWDDPRTWEERVERHPLVDECSIGRDGINQLLIRVTEVEPVALVATPVLVPVDAAGRLLPIDPARHALDLPILDGEPTPADAPLTDPKSLRALLAIDRLRASHPQLTDLISEIRPADGRTLELRMIPGSRVGRILLLADEPVLGLDRVESALSRLGDHQVSTADARFRGQVILKPKEGA